MSSKLRHVNAFVKLGWLLSITRPIVWANHIEKRSKKRYVRFLIDLTRPGTSKVLRRRRWSRRAGKSGVIDQRA